MSCSFRNAKVWGKNQIFSLITHCLLLVPIPKLMRDTWNYWLSSCRQPLAANVCGGCRQRSVSCARREWSWDIGDKSRGFLQCQILVQDVNSKSKLTISDQYLYKALFLLPLNLSNNCFLVCTDEIKQKWLLRYCILVDNHPLQHVHRSGMLTLVYAVVYNSYLEQNSIKEKQKCTYATSSLNPQSISVGLSVS